jgi:hypothetical protein
MTFKPKEVTDKPKLEVIHWRDHCSVDNSGWKDTRMLCALSPTDVVSVGWVIAENKDCLVILSHSARDGNNNNGEMCIVKSAIKTRRKIKDPSVSWKINV